MRFRNLPRGTFTGSALFFLALFTASFAVMPGEDAFTPMARLLAVAIAGLAIGSIAYGVFLERAS